MPLIANTWGNSSPSKIRQSMQFSSRRSNSVPLAKRKPSMSSETVDSAPVGLSSSPPDDAAWTKKRLGHVGPGIDENQLSQRANSLASFVSTGSCVSAKHFMMFFGFADPTLL